MENPGQHFFVGWPESFKAGAEVVGGKGWNLGRLHRYGFAVPRGGVLTTTAYRDFIDHNHLRATMEDIATAVTIDNLQDSHILDRLEGLRKGFWEGTFPPTFSEALLGALSRSEILDQSVAVRSSASCEDSSLASFAGIHDSFLNVSGLSGIMDAIKACYASLWSPRAMAYRRKMDIGDFDVDLAVVILEMVQAESAGVAFSCDPGTGREDVMLITANFGLGESVVAGSVEPDQYSVATDLSKITPQIVAKTIGRKEGMTVIGRDGGTDFVETAGQAARQVLSDEKVSELGLLTLRVFEALGEGERHQDIEWAFSGGKFVLVQARPATALPTYVSPGLRNRPQFWSNGNFRDTAPMVLSTVNRSLTKHMLNAILNAPYKAAGYPLLEGLQHSRFFQGRVYYNLSMAQWNGYDAFGTLPAETNTIIGGHQPEISVDVGKTYRGVAGLRRIGRIMKLLRAVDRSKKKAPTSFALVHGLSTALRKKQLGPLGDRELLLELSTATQALMEFAPEFGLLVCPSATIRSLIKELEKDFPGKGNALGVALMAGGAEITSAAHGYRLMEMAEAVRRDPDARIFFAAEPFDPLSWEEKLPEHSPIKQSFRAFLEEFGHRAVYEVEIMNPRWREDPSYLLQVVRSMIETVDLQAMKRRQLELSEGAWREIRRKLPLHRRLLVSYLAKQSREGAEIREMAKSICFMLNEPLRKMLLEAGCRLKRRGLLREREDVFHLAWSELVSILRGDWDGKGIDVLVEERQARRAEFEAVSPPDVICGDTPQERVRPLNCAGDALVGLGAAAGKGEGAARIVLHPNEGTRLANGEVLVAPSTDPGWTPLFLRSSAIVMETGGHLSHGAIVAREYGIPAVVNIAGVLRLIRDGQHVTVDGDLGKVFLS